MRAELQGVRRGRMARGKVLQSSQGEMKTRTAVEMTIRQVEHAALNGTAEKLCDVSLPITCKLDCSDYT